MVKELQLNRSNSEIRYYSISGSEIFIMNYVIWIKFIILSFQWKFKQYPTLKDFEFIWLDCEIMSELFDELFKVIEGSNHILNELMKSKKKQRW